MVNQALKSADTRQQIVEAAFAEIHRHGFQAASIAQILSNLGITKGAIYHHFPNKLELGYAVVEDVIWPMVQDDWITPLNAVDNPLDTMIRLLREASGGMTAEELELGCPLSNLSQEMSSLDEGFRQRIEHIYNEWRQAVRLALKSGQEKELVRQDIDVDVYATFIVSSMQGCLGAAKNARNLTLLEQCGMGLVEVLTSLKT